MFNLKKSLAVVALAIPILGGWSVSVGQTIAVVHVDIKNGSLNAPNFGMDGWGPTKAHRFLQDAITDAQTLLEEPFSFDEVRIWIAAAFDDTVSPPKPMPCRLGGLGGF